MAHLEPLLADHSRLLAIACLLLFTNGVVAVPPSEVTCLICGYGLSRLSWWLAAPVLAAQVVANVSGHLLTFLLVRRYRTTVLARIPTRAAARVEKLMHRLSTRSPAYLGLLRLVPGARTQVSWAAGLIGSFSPRSFALHSAWGITLWLATFDALGAFFYVHRGTIESITTRSALVVLAFVVVVAAAASRRHAPD